MKRVAFVFSTVPHGSSSGREGLDALLATSALTEDLGVFFIGDGVFKSSGTTTGCRAGSRLYRNLQAVRVVRYRSMLALCRLITRAGPPAGGNFVVDATALEPEDLRRELGNYDVILRF